MGGVTQCWRRGVTVLRSAHNKSTCSHSVRPPTAPAGDANPVLDQPARERTPDELIATVSVDLTDSGSRPALVCGLDQAAGCCSTARVSGVGEPIERLSNRSNGCRHAARTVERGGTDRRSRLRADAPRTRRHATLHGWSVDQAHGAEPRCRGLHRSGPPEVHLRQDRRTHPWRTRRTDLPRALHPRDGSRPKPRQGGLLSPTIWNDRPRTPNSARPSAGRLRSKVADTIQNRAAAPSARRPNPPRRPRDATPAELCWSGTQVV